MSAKKYLIGIDLGTTNCTMAYMHAGGGAIEQFTIPQLLGAGKEGEGSALPSFLYFPLEEEFAKGQAALSWDASRRLCVGTYARDRGAEVPSRLVASAKSWLCHGGIDRREALLPCQGDGEKISPLGACAELLRHLREAWDSRNSDAPFAAQEIFITVPASFDPAARQLVQDAAEAAGYPDVILLEEPLAAFYAWLQQQGDGWRKQLQVGDTILVVDIGGGTTDFSLIAVEDQGGDLGLKRIAVGAHLLLGGDNIDLALAYMAKAKLEEQGHTIDDWQMQALTHSCRSAKEKLLGSQPPKSVDVTVMGRSSKLIGGALKTTLTLAEVQALVLDGFIPLVGAEERSAAEKRLGLQQVGLPYAEDARISCQLARFLSLTGEGDKGDLERFVVPTAVLFNGGTLKAAALRARLLELLNRWATAIGKPAVKELGGADFDFAVSRGAAFYGQARSGKAIRVKSGTSRSYYIGVEDAVPAVPGMPIPLKAVCIVPYGMEEGSELALDTQEFSLLLGQAASFRFFSCSAEALPDGTVPAIGTVVRRWKQDLVELHPIESRMEREEGDGKSVRIKLRSRVTELGVLELWCVAPDGRRWKLEFDIRHEQPAFC